MVQNKIDYQTNKDTTQKSKDLATLHGQLKINPYTNRTLRVFSGPVVQVTKEVVRSSNLTLAYQH